MPLALDPRLIQSARLHAQDIAAATFAHTNPSGLTPGPHDRAGYPWFGLGQRASRRAIPTPRSALKALIIDTGSLTLGIATSACSTGFRRPLHREVGIGFAPGGTFGGYSPSTPATPPTPGPT